MPNVRERRERLERKIARGILGGADVRAVNTGHVGELFLPGTISGGGGGGSYRMGPGGRIECGGHSHSHWEDDAVVIVSHRFHAGHELVIEERNDLWTAGLR